MWPKVSKREWQANERRTNAEVHARATDIYGVERCEICGKTGTKFRPLAISHTDPKGMGGTRHLYTAQEKQLLCATCHSQYGHNIKEVT